MRVRIVSLGTNWWSAHPQDVTDPFCFRRNAAWFNSSGLKYGNRMRLCWVYPGQVRFNQTSGFNPELPSRVLRRTFECKEPNRMHGRMHLLMAQAADRHIRPQRYLVTLTERLCGRIRFSRPGWKSDGVQLISASVRKDRYELMALMGENDWIEGDLGQWVLSTDATRLELSCAFHGGQR